MARRLAAMGALLVLSLGAPAAQAAWLQAGYDAAHTGTTPDHGPRADEVAWTVRLPGARGDWTYPYLDGGNVYAVTHGSYHPDVEGAVNGIWEVDLATAEPRLVVELPEGSTAWVMDGANFYIALDTGVEAYAREGGRARWRWDFPSFFPGEAETDCASPALRNGTVYLTCRQEAYSPDPDPGFFEGRCCAVRNLVFAAVLDAATGALRWTWTVDDSAQARQAGPLPGAPPRPANLSGTLFISHYSPSVVGPYVLLTTYEEYILGYVGFPTGASAYKYSVWALQESDGQLLWTRNTTVRRVVQAGATEDTAVGVGGGGSFAGVATGDANIAYLKLDQLHAVNPGRGNDVWNRDIGQEDVALTDNDSGFALSEDALYTASGQTVYRLDSKTGEKAWSYTLDPASNEGWGTTGFILADGTLYGRTFGGGPTGWENAIYAFDAADGTLLWKRFFPTEEDRGVPWGPLSLFGLGDGAFVVHNTDGNLTVVGRTAASLQPALALSTDYPQPGDEVRVDLSGTRAGAFGAPTAYRAEWGDGTAAEWQASPVFTHTYAERGDYRARFSARNDAGQLSTEFATFRVGAPAPVELNPLQQAFAPENQELTLFALGLAITGAATIPGVARLRSRKQRLTRELRTLDEAYAQTQERPAECEAALAERKAHARGLLLDGKLDETQFHVFERRCDEFASRLRLRTLDRRFAFLPHGMVLTLQGMLADGRINAWEHQTLLDILERDQTLSGDQKQRVRELIDGWFASDAGRA